MAAVLPIVVGLIIIIIIIIIIMYDCASNNWSHWNSNKKLKEKFGNCTRKTFDRFTTKDSYTWNITHNTESTAVWSSKPEQWGSLLVQEKYQEEKACEKRHPYRKIIIIIIIIIITTTTTTTTRGGFEIFTSTAAKNRPKRWHTHKCTSKFLT